MIDLEQYNRLKKKADDMRAEVQRSEGALQQLMQQLKTDFGCDTIEEAEAKLADLERQEKDAEASYQTELTAFKDKWGDLLK